MDESGTTRMDLPAGLGALTIRDCGEHQQGAADIHFELPFPIDGRREFRSTNGCALVASGGRFLFLHDACVLVRIDLASREIAHLLPPRDWYFHGVAERDGVLEIELYDSDNRLAHITTRTADASFVAGMGPVVLGRFPSAFP
jgi:hypothetical protein